MSDKLERLDAGYLAAKRAQLHKLQDSITRVRASQHAEQSATRSELLNEAREFEDDAQKLTTLELQENISAVDGARLANIRRAIQKIDEGTYGLSDASGVVIPAERLEAVPEALFTLEEQAARDAAI